MATLDLLPRKCFEITLDDGKVIKGQFSTWALKRLTDKRGASLPESGAILQTLGGLIDFILCAVEYVSRKNSEGFSYNDVHVSDWLDELGGVNDPNFLAITKHMNDEVKEGTEGSGEEKKTDL